MIMQNKILKCVLQVLINNRYASNMDRQLVVCYHILITYHCIKYIIAILGGGQMRVQLKPVPVDRYCILKPDCLTQNWMDKS